MLLFEKNEGITFFNMDLTLVCNYDVFLAISGKIVKII